ncbi:histone-lysine N-methyltransferase SETMAR [Trichonephila clavipes]|uniref:Histone-lysine N-methyltransferase SETMAR n=1 Tax=Trichonephila clavipes TaxID=2585209 RepID=A0A8X6V9L0_TRICX|nr:histone-lysine N-methyltransferase SETMAR [Trichonephila clavipes]
MCGRYGRNTRHDPINLFVYHIKNRHNLNEEEKGNDVYGEGVLTVRQCQNGCAKLRSGNFDVLISIFDVNFSGRPADKDAIKALVDIGLLNLSNSTVYDHLKGLGLARYGVPMFLQREICVAALTSAIRFSNVTKMIRF